MASEIRIPKLGMSATEMTLLEWMFGDGDAVSKGDVIYTVETDKSTTEVEAPGIGHHPPERRGGRDLSGRRPDRHDRIGPPVQAGHSSPAPKIRLS